MSVMLWYYVTGPLVVSFPSSGVEYGTWGVCLFMIVFGQALNFGIYYAIGETGVYYGFKLGKEVPWHHGFPFVIGSVPIPHPQYLGSILSLWGVIPIVWSPHHGVGLVVIALWWTLMYCFTGWTEGLQEVDNKES